jgi:hypothetical protein
MFPSYNAVEPSLLRDGFPLRGHSKAQQPPAAATQAQPTNQPTRPWSPGAGPVLAKAHRVLGRLAASPWVRDPWTSNNTVAYENIFHAEFWFTINIDIFHVKF